MHALKAFLQETGGADVYRNLRVRYKAGSDPVLYVANHDHPTYTTISLQEQHDDADALHELLRAQGFVEQDLRDSHTDCADWAYKGQCFANPDFMLDRCPKSCRDWNPDAHDDCAALVAAGKCASDPIKMSKECCASCMAHTEDKDEL